MVAIESQNSAEIESILVVCTLNRPKELEECLLAAAHCVGRPAVAVVVSADTTTRSKIVIERVEKESGWEITHLKAQPGLAQQRNMGIDYALSRAPHVKYIHFIDDDVLVHRHYFSTIEQGFKSHPTAILIGGRDALTSPLSGSWTGRIFGTHSFKQGIILRSTYNSAFSSLDGVHAVDWVHGSSQSFRVGLLKEERFDSDIRFYGEEVDMHIRCAALGEILYSADATYFHNSSQVGRESLKISIFETDLARWNLCRKYPEVFSKTRMLLATVAHAAALLLRSVAGRSTSDREIAQGHITFLVRLLNGQK